MPKNILGISAFYHDSAAALVSEEGILAAAQEERFSRKKHDPRFPVHSVNYCLEEAFIETSELDAIVYYDNPVVTFDRVLQAAIKTGPSAKDQFERAADSVLGSKVWLKEKVEKAIGKIPDTCKLLVTEHHFSHAASAFYPSPFSEAAIITLDGVGEWATTTIGIGKANKIEILEEITFPHSLGLLYSAFTHFCGFKVNSGEYKLMGLAPYGRPIFKDAILSEIIDVKPDGSFRLNMEYFSFLERSVMTSSKFEDLFDGPAREPESKITRREMDIAASIQAVTEEVVLAIATHTRQMTGLQNLVMAGGVALNCVANGKLLMEGIFDDIWLQPAAGDAGGALGGALQVLYEYFDTPRTVVPGKDSQKGSYLGPKFSSNEVAAFLKRKDYPSKKIDDDQERARIVAEEIANGKVIGLMQGRMEFGPRALGGRSILGDPRSDKTQSVMNLKIKFRESFRPFAPSVLASDVSDYFEMDCESPYMLMVAPVNRERRLNQEHGDEENMLTIINEKRSDLPAITHVDYSARIQTVSNETNPFYHKLISAFKESTGCGVLVNTSFNVRGEPIVCSPQDAYTCFMRTEMDVLVLEDYVLWKTDQPQFEDKVDWKTTYELD